MTPHDAERRDRALACDRDDLASLEDAIRGLQSTDDPSLVPLHDELMARWRELREAPSQDRDDAPHDAAVADVAVTLLAAREHVCEQVVASRERSLVLTKLDEAMLWLGVCDVTGDSRDPGGPVAALYRDLGGPEA